MLVPVAPLPSRLSITTRLARTAATADVALDRRGGPRGLSRAEDRALARALDAALELDPSAPDEPTTTPVDHFTAAAHRPLPVLFGVRVPRARLEAGPACGDDAWMITRGLSITDGGLLMLALDPRSAPIDPIERVAQRAWSNLWLHVGTRQRSSALAMVSACVQLPQLLAAIAELAQRSGGIDAVAPIEIELIPLWVGSADDGRALTPGDDAPILGTLAPLADPRAGVLAVGIDALAMQRLHARAQLVAPTTTRSRAPAVVSAPAEAEPAGGAPAPHEPTAGPRACRRRAAKRRQKPRDAA